MDLTPEPGKDPKRNDLRAEVERLTSLMRAVDLFGTGFVWTDPRTGLEHMPRAVRQGDGDSEAARTVRILREYADRHHYLGGGHGPISTPGGWIDPDAWCACGAAWVEDEGGCSERVQLLAEAISLGRSVQGDGDSPTDRIECEGCGRTQQFCKCGDSPEEQQ